MTSATEIWKGKEDDQLTTYQLHEAVPFRSS